MEITNETDTNELVINGDTGNDNSNITITRSKSPIPSEDIELLANPSLIDDSHNSDRKNNDTTNDSDNESNDVLSTIDESGEDSESDNDSEVSGSGSELTVSTLDQSSIVEPTKPKSYEEILAEKQEILYGFEKLKKYSLYPTKDYDMSSDINVMRSEYKKLVHKRNVEKSLKFQRQILIGFTTGIEFLNSKFDVGVDLDGWSENVRENIYEYDEVFEELYEKYKDQIEVMPELKLLFMIGSSAAYFHFGKKIGSKINVNSFLENNPELMRDIKNVQRKAQNLHRQQTTNPVLNSNRKLNTKMRGPDIDVDDILNS